MRQILMWIGIFFPVIAFGQFNSDRPDSLTTSTRGALQRMLDLREPMLSFRADMQPDSFAVWQQSMTHAMQSLMRHPTNAQTAQPVLLWAEPREDYRLEMWESYPFDGYAVPYYVLVPDGIDTDHQAIASVICIPGFGQTKELVAGELPGHTAKEDPNAQAQLLAQQGYVAVAVDNPSFGQLSDEGVADYLNSSRMLLEMDWSYLGLASYQDKIILDWLKEQPHTRRDRIIVSGFSLGTEPLMALGLLDDEIYAFVYNDFLCRTRERILVMTKPDADGNRPFPNNIEHLIPGFLLQFDFPDIVCALAPRPVICTEGGMDRDFDLVKAAYEKAGARDNFTCHHYAKFADPADRQPLEQLPQGLDRKEYFRLANVDPPHHYYKAEYIIPWLKTILQ